MGKVLQFKPPRTGPKLVQRARTGECPKCGHKLDVHIAHPNGVMACAARGCLAIRSRYVDDGFVFIVSGAATATHSGASFPPPMKRRRNIETRASTKRGQSQPARPPAKISCADASRRRAYRRSRPSPRRSRSTGGSFATIFRDRSRMRGCSRRSDLITRSGGARNRRRSARNRTRDHGRTLPFRCSPTRTSISRSNAG